MCHESNFASLKKITDENIFETLKNYKLSKIKSDYFIPGFQLNDQIKDFESLFKVSLSREIMTPSYVKKEIKKSL